MQLLLEGGRFSASQLHEPTFSSTDPDRTIDWILAPPRWSLTDYRVLESTPSDHLPVAATLHWED